MNTKQLIRKITLSAMFIAMGLVLDRVLMIPLGEVNRIAFGSSAVILSSFIVGPLFGLIIGASVDLIGFMINSVGTYTPFVTLGYMFLGSLPFFLGKVIHVVKNKRILIVSGYILLVALIAYGFWFVHSRDSYNFTLGFNEDGSPKVLAINLTNLWIRYVAPIISAIVFIGFFTFIQRKIQEKEPTFKGLTSLNLMVIVLVVEVLISIVWGVQWRFIYFGIPQNSPTAFVFYFNQVAFFVIAFPVKSLIVIYGYKAYQRYQNLVK
jgi:ECF transporter S component (folate family)